MIWPLLLGAPETAEHFRGVAWCLLSTVAMLALLQVALSAEDAAVSRLIPAEVAINFGLSASRQKLLERRGDARYLPPLGMHHIPFARDRVIGERQQRSCSGL